MNNLHERTFELLEQGALNWSVKHQPRPFSGYRVVRQDNGKFLGHVRESSGAAQNAVLCEAIIKAGDRLGLVFDRSGSHFNGRQVYFQAPIAQTLVGRTSVLTLATVTYAHVGEQLLTFGTTDCWEESGNIFHSDFSSSNAVDLRDSQALADMIYGTMLQHRSVTALYRRMAAAELSECMEAPIMIPVVRDGMGITDPSPAERDRLEYLRYTIDKQLERSGRNLWGVFSGIVRYAHKQHRCNTNQSLMIGPGHELTTIAYSAIRNWLDGHNLQTKYGDLSLN